MPDEISIAIALTLLLSTLVSVSQVPIIYDDLTNEYVSAFRKMENAYKNLVDDLMSAMEVAERFKDPSYNYDPRDLVEAVNMDGRNGTQELIDVFNELMNLTSKYLNESIKEP